MSDDGVYEVGPDGELYAVTDLQITSNGVTFQEIPEGQSAPQPGDDLTFVQLQNDAQVGTLQVDNILYVFQEGHLPAGSVGYDLIATSVTSTGVFGQPTDNPCFTAGTRIAVPQGKISVEQLLPGDEVCLANGGIGRIRWMGHRQQKHATVIRLRMHALSPGIPSSDLTISRDHGIFLLGKLVPAELLTNDSSIAAEIWDAADFWHVELESHDLLLAEDAAVESYLDTGNRAQFGNCSLTYDPLARAHVTPCAETVLGGDALVRIRRSLFLIEESAE